MITSMTRRASAQSRTISAGGAIVVSPENATCSLWSERATTHSLERSPLWPALCRPRLAGFEVSTEGLSLPPGRGEKAAERNPKQLGVVANDGLTGLPKTLSAVTGSLAPRF